MPAKTREDVEAQSTKDRLWESLDYSYGQQRKANDQSYDRAYSQADNQLLSRGMQRSSYGAQTLANINQQRIDSNNNIWAAQIADYQNRLTDAENQEWQRDFQERQFAEGQRQFNTNLDFQKERAAVGDNQWQQQFDYGKQRDAVSDQQWNTTFNYQQQRDAVGDAQWEKQFAEGVRQNDKSSATNYVMSILAGGKMPSDELLAQVGLSRADAELIRLQHVQQAAGSGSPGPARPKTTDDDTGDDNGDTQGVDFAKLMRTLDFAGLNALRTRSTASMRGMIDAQKDIDSGTATTNKGAHAILQGGLNARTSTLALDRKKK